MNFLSDNVAERTASDGSFFSSPWAISIMLSLLKPLHRLGNKFAEVHQAPIKVKRDAQMCDLHLFLQVCVIHKRSNDNIRFVYCELLFLIKAQCILTETCPSLALVCWLELYFRQQHDAQWIILLLSLLSQLCEKKGRSSCFISLIGGVLGA